MFWPLNFSCQETSESHISEHSVDFELEPVSASAIPESEHHKTSFSDLNIDSPRVYVPDLSSHNQYQSNPRHHPSPAQVFRERIPIIPGNNIDRISSDQSPPIAQQTRNSVSSNAQQSNAKEQFRDEMCKRDRWN